MIERTYEHILRLEEMEDEVAGLFTEILQLRRSLAQGHRMKLMVDDLMFG